MTVEKGERIRRGLTLIGGAAIYAVLYAFCSQIDEKGITDAGQALPRFLAAFPVGLVVLIVLLCFLLPQLELTRRRKEKPFCTWRACVLLFCCYVPLFLIQYPGSFTYDVGPQAMQVATGKYNTFHPILHTLLLRAALLANPILDSFEKCMALCSLIQMAVISGCFAEVCASLSRSVSRRAAVLAWMFFALYPAHMAFACTYTKDAMFAAFLALFLTLHAEKCRFGHLKTVQHMLYVLSGVVCCMLRNNMIYAMVVWAAVLGIIALCSKRFARQALGALLVMALAILGQAALEKCVGAEKGSIGEMLSVPAQQMARVRVMAPEKLTQEECSRMDDLLPGVNYSLYDPTIADPIKDKLSQKVFLGDPGAMLDLWLGIGKKAPRVYLDAFLNLALPSLYPYSSYKVTPPYIETGECKITLTMPFGLPQIKQPGRFAPARDWLDEHIYATGADHHPVLRWLFNTGFIFWVLLLFVLYDLYCGRWQRVLMALLPMLLWGTYLLGPVMQGRYLYPFVCILPVMLLRPRISGTENQ